MICFTEAWSPLTFFDVATFTYQSNTMSFPRKFRLSDNNALFIYKNSLPSSVARCEVPAILYYHKSKPDFIQEFCEFEISCSFSSLEISNIKLQPVTYLSIANQKLQEECQHLAGSILVQAGEYPLFIDPQQPSYELLARLYKQFLRFNDETRLQEQFQNSQNYCYARAHFVSLLLSHYGITSMKVFKHWNPWDWRRFLPPAATHAWHMHCATLITDSNNQKWIWDPWVGFNQQLLTIDQWLNFQGQPKPIKLLITNCVILEDSYYGRTASGEFIRDDNLVPAIVFNAFQAICTSATPNSPELPIAHKKSKEIKITRHANHRSQLFFKEHLSLQAGDELSDVRPKSN